MLDSRTGKIVSRKAPTTPSNFAEGVISCIKALNIDLNEVTRIIHGTTICTNALIERKEAKTGFIGTKGFSDEFDIQRMVRRWGKTFYSSIYDFQQNKPTPFVPRFLRMEVDERVVYPGKIVKELNESEAKGVVKKLEEGGVKAIAVCFLWSFTNPENELRLKKIINEMYPEIYACISSDVVPTFREYERMVTTAINASLMPVISEYISNVEGELAKEQLGGTLFLMQSHGGVAYPAVVKDKPIYTLRGGPVAGVVATNYLGKLIQRKNLISYDMGGTSCDVGLILDNNMSVLDETEVGYYPVKVPTADISCIGAGGGSIAYIDYVGALRVGPESAGASPGPACYGQGGTQPTVSDANLILGRINPDYFCGGKIGLNKELACQSVQKIADAFGWDILEAANAIIRISIANMGELVRLRTVDRGHDPREFSLVGFGGAGPLHASLIAEETAIPEVIIPVEPGAFSALGMVVSELSYYDQASYLVPVSEVTPEKLNEEYDRLERIGRDVLEKGKVREEDMLFVRSAAMRYILQEWEVHVPVPSGRIDASVLEQIVRDFHAAHRARYGYAREDKPVEFVTLFLKSMAVAAPFHYEKKPVGTEDPGKAEKARREVFIDEKVGAREIPVYERSLLMPGNVVKGPAIIEEPISTTYIQPTWKGTIDEMGNIIIRATD